VFLDSSTGAGHRMSATSSMESIDMPGNFAPDSMTSLEIYRKVALLKANDERIAETAINFTK
jgi:hypothetical protein